MVKARKSLNFPTAPFFEAPFGGNSLEFCDEIWHQKSRIVALPDGEEILTLAFLRFDTIPTRDRQTDRQTDTLLSHRPASQSHRVARVEIN